MPGILGTSGPIGFEPGMFKKEVDETKPKGESTNKVNKILLLTTVLKNIIFEIIIVKIYFFTA